MIIEVDEYKTKVEGYNPDSSEDFHAESARLANSDFVAELKTHKYNKVILMGFQGDEWGIYIYSLGSWNHLKRMRAWQ